MKRTTKREARRLALLYAGLQLGSQDEPGWMTEPGRIDPDDHAGATAFMDELKAIGFRLISRAAEQAMRESIRAGKGIP